MEGAANERAGRNRSGPARDRSAAVWELWPAPGPSPCGRSRRWLRAPLSGHRARRSDAARAGAPPRAAHRGRGRGAPGALGDGRPARPMAPHGRATSAGPRPQRPDQPDTAANVRGASLSPGRGDGRRVSPSRHGRRHRTPHGLARRPAERRAASARIDRKPLIMKHALSAADIDELRRIFIPAEAPEAEGPPDAPLPESLAEYGLSDDSGRVAEPSTGTMADLPLCLETPAQWRGVPIP